MNEYVKTICLANKEPTEETKIVLISGWGDTSEGGSYSDVLMKAIVSIVSRKRCSIMYGELVPKALITNQMFCAASFGKDTCRRDSGGSHINNLYQFFIQIKYITLNC